MGIAVKEHESAWIKLGKEIFISMSFVPAKKIHNIYKVRTMIQEFFNYCCALLIPLPGKICGSLVSKFWQ